ncbi:MAG: hypothetical protein KBI35_10030 [Ruminococcus sp.]|nr:hypothetical protein [Ruminococcus sp.]
MEGKEFVTYYGVRNTAEVKPKSDDKDSDKKTTTTTNTAKVSSPKTGRTLPAVGWSLLGVSAASAAGCLLLRRKEDENNG